MASPENSQLSLSFLLSPSFFHCCSMCQSSTLHYGLITTPLASLLSMKGSNRVIAAYYCAIREDDLPLISPLYSLARLSTSSKNSKFVFLQQDQKKKHTHLCVCRTPVYSDRYMQTCCTQAVIVSAVSRPVKTLVLASPH